MRIGCALSLLAAFAVGGCYLSHTVELADDAAALIDAGDAGVPPLAHLHDINGDGYDDIVIGNYVDGEVVVYLGGPITSPSAPVITLTTPAMTTPYAGKFGISIAIGDVDADGYADVIVGEPNANGIASGTMETGRVYVYSGGPAGPASAPSTTLVGPGGATGHFGAAVASAGDVNRDGYTDIVIGSPDSGAGLVHLHLGGASGLALTAVTTLNGATIPRGDSATNVGESVAGAGDVNGDGYADVIVGGFADAAHAAAAFIYLGTGAGLAPTPFTILRHRFDLGAPSIAPTVGSAGDTNGDGYTDVIVTDGTVITDGLDVVPSGAVRIYLGSAIAIGPGIAATLTPDFPGAAAGRYSLSAATAGDVNRDGYDDVVLGVANIVTSHGFMFDGTPDGLAFVYMGSPSGLGSLPVTTLHGGGAALPAGAFGRAVASAGDFTGDGYPDLIIGAPDVTVMTGSAVEWFGSPSGITETVSVLLFGDHQFGASLGSAAVAVAH